jgi:hypothetical protein
MKKLLALLVVTTTIQLQSRAAVDVGFDWHQDGWNYTLSVWINPPPPEAEPSNFGIVLDVIPLVMGVSRTISGTIPYVTDAYGQTWAALVPGTTHGIEGSLEAREYGWLGIDPDDQQRRWYVGDAGFFEVEDPGPILAVPEPTGLAIAAALSIPLVLNLRSRCSCSHGY